MRIVIRSSHIILPATQTTSIRRLLSQSEHYCEKETRSSNQPDIQIKPVTVRGERQSGAGSANLDHQVSSEGILQIPHAMRTSRTDIPRFLDLTSIGT